MICNSRQWLSGTVKGSFPDIGYYKSAVWIGSSQSHFCKDRRTTFNLQPSNSQSATVIEDYAPIHSPRHSSGGRHPGKHSLKIIDNRKLCIINIKTTKWKYYVIKGAITTITTTIVTSPSGETTVTTSTSTDSQINFVGPSSSGTKFPGSTGSARPVSSSGFTGSSGGNAPSARDIALIRNTWALVKADSDIPARTLIE